MWNAPSSISDSRLKSNHGLHTSEVELRLPIHAIRRSRTSRSSKRVGKTDLSFCDDNDKHDEIACTTWIG